MKTFFKMFIFFISTVIVLSFTKFENNPKSVHLQISSSETMILSSKKMDGNNISTWFQNNGNFNSNPFSVNPGFEWLKASNKYARWSSGIWIGAKVGKDTLVTVADYSAEYLPGYIDQNGNPQGKDDPLYRIYRIDEGDTISSDYQNWPVNQGAHLNQMGRPLQLGKQTMFYTYTDGYPESHNNNAGSTNPLKAEILQTSWCYDLPDHLYNIIFTECRIINKHDQAWVNAYIGLWTDDDIGDGGDDGSGCDSTLNLTFAYNFTPHDGVYGNAPPAVGFLFLQGLQSLTGNVNDTAFIQYPPGIGIIKKVGYLNLNLTSFNYYRNADPNIGHPGNFRESYRSLQGFTLTGRWVNPITNNVSNFPFSGDPESGTGWIVSQGRDVRYLSSLGPVNVNPNDTQYLIYAQIIAKGTSNLNSVTKLKEAALIAKQIYDENFTNVVSVKNLNQNIPEKFYLYQNFPNPFNPETKIQFDVMTTSNVTLKVYDISGRLISTLIDDQKLTPGMKQITFDAKGLPSGIYFYTLEAENFIETKKMILLK